MTEMKKHAKFYDLILILDFVFISAAYKYLDNTPGELVRAFYEAFLRFAYAVHS